MLILLPPSEGKTVPHSGPRLKVAELAFPQLQKTRRSLLASLITLCRIEPEQAAAALGLGPRQWDEIRGNAELRRRPSAPAIEIYTGVLFESLGYRTLTAAQRRKADERVLIASALWGLVRPSDVIPPYRLSGGTSLPGVGTMRSVWHVPLFQTLEKLDGPVLDLRSGAYRDLAPTPAREDWLSLRVFEERGGKRTIVSHNNKATKGAVARAVLTSRRDFESGRSLIAGLSSWGYRVEHDGGPGSPIDIIVG